MKPASSHVLEVERAISDLRRGMPVRLTEIAGRPVRLRSGEHWPEERNFIGDAGHPGVQLLKLAGLLPHAVIDRPQTEEGVLLNVTAQAIAQYPVGLATSLERVSEARVPLKGAEHARIIAFRPRFGHEEHLAVVIGAPEEVSAPYVRIHSSCVTGDIFGSLRCDCGGQLDKAIAMMGAAGSGAILYLSQEGRGIGIANKLRAYGLQDKGMDTVEANETLGFAADERDFALAARMLKELNLTRITLLTNNPRKIAAMEAHGITVERREPLTAETTVHNAHYLDTKSSKLGHLF